MGTQGGNRSGTGARIAAWAAAIGGWAVVLIFAFGVLIAQSDDGRNAAMWGGDGQGIGFAALAVSVALAAALITTATFTVRMPADRFSLAVSARGLAASGTAYLLTWILLAVMHSGGVGLGAGLFLGASLSAARLLGFASFVVFLGLHLRARRHASKESVPS